MRKRQWLTTLERDVLTAVSQIPENAHGVTIFLQLEKMKGKQVRFGKVYTALDRLEEKGCVSTWMSPGGPERGGRQKQNYRLEEIGKASLRNPEWNPNPSIPDPPPWWHYVLYITPIALFVLSVLSAILGARSLVIPFSLSAMVLFEIGKRVFSRRS